MSKTIAIDFDQTLTRDMNYDPYPALGEELPDLEMIRWVNEQYEYNDVVIHTARDESLRQDTKEWLEHNDVKYDKLVMDKLQADVYIDDKAVRPDEAKTAHSVNHINHI